VEYRPDALADDHEEDEKRDHERDETSA